MLLKSHQNKLFNDQIYRKTIIKENIFYAVEALKKFVNV